MSDLGRREWVALALFAFSLLVAATFLDATAGSTDIPPRTPVLGEPIDHQAEPPRHSPHGDAKPVPASSGEWYIRYYMTSTGELQRGALTDGLHVEFQVTPFDLPDSDWHIVAETAVDLEPGEHSFTVQHIAAVQIFVDGEEVASGSHSPGPRTLTALFHHDGGTATVRIVAEHTGGPFLVTISP